MRTLSRWRTFFQVLGGITLFLLFLNFFLREANDFPTLRIALAVIFWTAALVLRAVERALAEHLEQEHNKFIPRR